MAHFFLVMFLVRLVVASRHEAGHGKSEIDDDGYMTEVTMENLQKTQMLLEAEIRELYAQKDMLAAENVKLRAENAKLKGGSALLEYEGKKNSQWRQGHVANLGSVAREGTNALPAVVLLVAMPKTSGAAGSNPMIE
eukprot:CAMPEP_0172701466 /NCGR_PEP_ID=MMETSP1074-20121228/31658_1 /TAXON_ID=2916 /ORGANISM="Ceratium fusus, Strain PA161109" /LENGTH=136 /DNA_ID=CAMNT_0013523019 /DNA_START=79 /DNA_END=490 /DNA_ORIENTATION=-